LFRQKAYANVNLNLHTSIMRKRRKNPRNGEEKEYVQEKSFDKLG